MVTPRRRLPEEIFALDRENNVHSPTPKDREASLPGLVKFASEKDLIAVSANWPSTRLVEIWNKLPGVKPVNRFMDRKTALRRIWRAIQRLKPRDREPQATRAATAPGRGIAGATKAESGEHAGTKSDQIIDLLKRPSGATLKEILTLTGWQSHSVRGFISAQLVKKKGFRIRSFTRNGERVYRIRS